MRQRALAFSRLSSWWGIYGEIAAMDLVVLERVRKLLIGGSDDNDAAYRTHTRVVLGQLDRVSDRISYWPSEIRELVEAELR